YPHISYYDGTNYDLKYASYNGSAWNIQTVDSSGYVGQYTSLALDGSGQPHISYYDNSNDDLKYASYNGSAWNIQTVDSSGYVGKYTSLALDGSGYPHISYYDSDNDALKYTSYNGSAWNIQTVDSSGDVGEYTSLALDANGYPHISYYHDGSSFLDGSLKYAFYITAHEPLTITTTSLPNGSVGSSYSQTLSATGGTQPYTWSKISGNPPPGLNLNSSGAILGPPTTAGTFSFIVQVTDSSSPTPQTASKELSITITAPSSPEISVSPASHNFGSVTVGSFSAPKTFTISNTGNADLAIGTITLTGTDASEFSIQNDQCSGQTIPPGENRTVQVVFSPASEGAKSANLSIPSNDPNTPILDVPLSGEGKTDVPEPLEIVTSTSPIQGPPNEIYWEVPLQAIGGTPPYSWSKISGDLPYKLSLDGSTGVISGILHQDGVQQDGVFIFTVQVTDLSLPVQTARAEFSFHINVPPAENYAPIFIFDGSENYYPVDPFFAGDVNNDGEINIDDISNSFDVGKDLLGSFKPISPEDFKDFAPDNCNVKKYLETYSTPRDKRNNMKVFYHIYDEGNSWIYQYWLYYPFNTFSTEELYEKMLINQHYGDWEKVFVWVDKESMRPTRVAGSAHNEWNPNPYLDNPPMNRPYIFVEKGSHANIVNKDDIYNPENPEEDYSNKNTPGVWVLTNTQPASDLKVKDYILEEIGDNFRKKFLGESSFPNVTLLPNHIIPGNPPKHPWCQLEYGNPERYPCQFIYGDPKWMTSPYGGTATAGGTVLLDGVGTVKGALVIVGEGAVTVGKTYAEMYTLTKETYVGAGKFAFVNIKKGTFYTAEVIKNSYAKHKWRFKIPSVFAPSFDRSYNKVSKAPDSGIDEYLLGVNGNIYLVPEEKAFTISGTVTDENGNTLPYATVNIYDQDGRWLFTTLTDENGGYQMPLSEDLEYTVYASLGDETAMIDSVTGTHGETVTVTLTTTQGLDETPPVVTITSPNLGNNTTATQSPITISGTASDPETGITSITINTGQENTGDTANFSFLVELDPDTNIFVVTATDNAGNTGTDNIVVYYSSCSSPVANAGLDRTVSVNSPITLDGSNSSDPDGDPLTYQWTQTAGPTVSLSSS
ncbi:choice-of-anchor D domain-containing protein, partial [bacterium]|nr:choice-of-anchor D domain-containing protein [bacterium]